MQDSSNDGSIKNQLIPILLTVVVFAALVGILWGEVVILNLWTTQDIVLRVRWVDVAIGLTIYLKTSIDFAITIGNLMSQNGGWKNRVAIEIGTAVGNASGTFVILAIWAFFKEVQWLLAIMITLAALVLFRLAEEGLEHAKVEYQRYPNWFKQIVNVSEKLLERLNQATFPVLRFVVPNISMQTKGRLKFWPLFAFSLTIPFILGLDDFAGYVPLFNVVNVLGFAIGVFGGHMILNIMLYLSPQTTIRVVKNPVISLFGSAAFVSLGIWGLSEVVKLVGE